MKRAFAYFVFFLVLILAGCHSYRHSETDIIGKTSVQIVSEFGEFDCIGSQPGTDGLYRNSGCGYTVKEPHVGFLGTDAEVLLFIVFDHNGVAVRCYEGYRPGG